MTDSLKRRAEEALELSNAGCCDIADKIRHDICGRSGGDHWFEGCDKDIQQEILDAWEVIIARGVTARGVPAFARIVKAACEWRERMVDPPPYPEVAEMLDAILRGEGPSD
jgi:hypothetical protein